MEGGSNQGRGDGHRARVFKGPEKDADKSASPGLMEAVALAVRQTLSREPLPRTADKILEDWSPWIQDKADPSYAASAMSRPIRRPSAGRSSRLFGRSI